MPADRHIRAGGTSAAGHSSRPDAYAAPRPRVRYELRVDHMDDEPYRIERVEIIGHFPTREAARQHMIDTEDERKARDDGGDDAC